MTNWKLFKVAIKRVSFRDWFCRYWWQYLLEKDKYSRRGYCSKWRKLLCRAAGHPEGCWWYNPGGSEPDYHCKDCGDEI